MEPIQYLRALRQWWWVIVACAAVGVVLALVVIPGGSGEYTASQTLLSVGSSSDQTAGVPTLDQMAILVTRGDVPRMVAKELGTNPGSLATVIATPDSVGGTLTIAATGSDPRQTEAVANAYAKQLVASVDGNAKAEWDAAVATAQQRVDADTASLNALPPTASDAQRETLTNQLSSDTQSLAALRGQGPATSGLQSIDSAVAVPSGSGTSRTMRMLIAGAVGLLIGTGLALLLTRFDTRLHSREAVEDAFGFPVIGEIPLVARAQNRKDPVIVHGDPDSPAAEAYRSLRSTLLLAPRNRRPAQESRMDRARHSSVASRAANDHAHAIMVMSPGVGEGKSTCAANLAAAFGESGKQVLVLSCDLRRPAIDTYLGVPPDSPGVSEVLADGKDLAAVICDTDIPGVRVVPSGRPVGNPGELLTHGEDLLAKARGLADVVIVDTPPVLATDDTSAMIPRVDDVVIVCRAGSTGTEAARRAAERLNRLGAPIAGGVLVGAQSLPAVRGYYRAYVSKDAVGARPRPHAVTPVADDGALDDPGGSQSDDTKV